MLAESSRVESLHVALSPLVNIGKCVNLHTEQNTAGGKMFFHFGFTFNDEKFS